jgi:hypothetical protein
MPRGIRNKPALPVTEATIEAKMMAPAAPSPAVLELQSDVVNLVRERTVARKTLAEVQARLFVVQAEAQAAQLRSQQFEQEIQERINLIAQLENRAPAGNLVPFPGAYPLAGISAEPTMPGNAQPMGDPNDQINRGHASRAML